MEEFTTPSEKVRTYTNPQPIRTETRHSKKRKWVVIAKKIVGNPIPYLLLALPISFFISPLYVEILAFLISFCTACYVFVDRFSAKREFQFFRSSYEISLFFLLLLFIIQWTQGLLTGFEFLFMSRWIFYIYFFSYALNLFPGLNRIFFVAMISSVFAAVYGIFQHFTGEHLLQTDGIHFLYQSYSNWPSWYSMGLESSPLRFGLLLGLFSSFLFTSFLWKWRQSSKDFWFYKIAFLLLFFATYWTYDHRTWVAILTVVIVSSFFVKKRALFVILLSTSILFSILFNYSENFRLETKSVWTQFENLQEIEESSWQVYLDSVRSNLWIGNGKIKVTQDLWFAKREFPFLSPKIENTFLQFLINFGVLGLFVYMIFTIQTLLQCLKLFYEIPASHTWHKIFCISIISSLLAFHVSGLGHQHFQQPILLILFCFLLACISHMLEAYGRGIVPDDRSL